VSDLEDYDLSWQHLVEALPDGTALLDERGVMRYVSELLSVLTGFAKEELIGQSVQMLVPPRHRGAESQARGQYARDPSTRIIWSNRDLSVLCRDGSERSVDFALTPLTLLGKRWAVASIRDNSVQKAAEQARLEAEERFRLAFEENMSPMICTDLDDKIIAANDSFCEMIGFTNEELLGRDSKPFTHPDDVGITEETHRRVTVGEADRVRYVKRYLHKDGRVVVAEVSRSPARDADGKTMYFVISERDITEERALTAQLSHMALHDPLTGLANRALFEDRLVQAHARVVRQGGLGAVLLLDLDDFKGINDTLGHLAGDKLLAGIARRLEQVTRSTDSVCRFGGDEFVYLAEGLTSVDEVEQLANRLLTALAEPFSIAGAHIEQHASVGIVVWDEKSADHEEIVENADVALYEAKRKGKGRHVLFAPQMRQQPTDHSAAVQELRDGFRNGDVSMHYQPIVDLTTNEVVGFEALMRWHHVERGWVPPNVFLPLAEQSDLILELGDFAIREAVNAASSWSSSREDGVEPYVSVNLSARQFHDHGLYEMLAKSLRTRDFAPSRLVIEITEQTALLDVDRTIKVIEELNGLGVGIALDNFGTGSSSLSYLLLLNPKFIKIDQAFVRPARESTHDDTLLETIISLGNRLDMTMLAEGIETYGQLERLRGPGCEFGQGFLFSAAVPAAEVPSILARAPGSPWETTTAVTT
jgi:diguanylate cyclase (GGDEF)-like protein/PAS domain S-box-containing protein